MSGCEEQIQATVATTGGIGFAVQVVSGPRMNGVSQDKEAKQGPISRALSRGKVRQRRQTGIGRSEEEKVRTRERICEKEVGKLRSAGRVLWIPVSGGVLEG